MTTHQKTILAGPGGNYTAFVLDDVRTEDRLTLDQQLRRDDPRIEQTCFVSKADKGWHGEMAGSEFSGAPALSLGYLISTWEKCDSVEFSFSGAPQPISVTRNDDTVSSTLFPNVLYKTKESDEGLICIEFPGITYLVDCQPHGKQHDMASYMRNLIARHRLQNNPAVGLIQLEKRGQDITIDPWVWVKNVGSLINETACISGATAVGLIEYEWRGQPDFTIQIGQPCGTPTTVRYIKKTDATIDIQVSSKIVILE